MKVLLVLGALALAIGLLLGFGAKPVPNVDAAVEFGPSVQIIKAPSKVHIGHNSKTGAEYYVAPPPVEYTVTHKDGTVDGVIVNGESFREFILLRLCSYDKDSVRLSSQLVPFYTVGPRQRLKFVVGVAGVHRVEVCSAFAQ
jgi:hypothetical protein